MSSLQEQDLADAERVHSGTRLLLAAFLTLTFLAVVELLVFADSTDRDWAWSIHVEVTAAFLGAAYGAGFVLSALSLLQTRWSLIRIPVITVTVFTVLTLVATLIHTHRFNLSSQLPIARSAAWIWLAVYLVVPAACLAVVLRQERHRPAAEAVRRPMPRWLKVALAAQGAVLFAAGVVLFAGGLLVHHQPEEMARFWPWPVMPLSAQVVGAWLVALGVAAALAVRDGDLSRLLVPAVTYTAFGVFELGVVLRYQPQLTAEGAWLWLNLGVLAVIVATGGYGWWAARRSPPGRVGLDEETSGATAGAGRDS